MLSPHSFNYYLLCIETCSVYNVILIAYIFSTLVIHASITNPVPVSYTHLDVYKRQVYKLQFNKIVHIIVYSLIKLIICAHLQFYLIFQIYICYFLLTKYVFL